MGKAFKLEIRIGIKSSAIPTPRYTQRRARWRDLAGDELPHHIEDVAIELERVRGGFRCIGVVLAPLGHRDETLPVDPMIDVEAKVLIISVVVHMRLIPGPARESGA